MELKELKALKNGTIPTEQPSIQDKMVPAGEVLGSTIGKSTLADRKAIHNLPKFENGKGNPFANAALNVMGNIQQNHSNIFKTIGGALGGAAKAIGGAIGGAIGKISDFSENPNKTFGTNGNAVLSAATGAIGLTTGIIDAHQFNTTADDALQDAGTSEGNIGGVTYERQNAVNASQISEQTSAENKVNTIGLMGNGAVTGAAIGSIIPGGTLLGGAIGAIGGLVGGLFGAGSRKEKMERMLREARDKAYRKNDYARSGALTSAMQQQYAQQYGDTESQSLYGFSGGKEGAINPLTMTTVKNHIVETSHGKDYGPQNSWTEKDEVIWDTKNDPAGLNMHIVDHGPNDGARSFLTDSDAVFSRKGNMNLKALANAGNPIGLQAILNEQADMKQRKSKGLFAAKCGKLPGFNEGLWSNIIGHGLPLISEIVQGNKISKQKVESPDTYSGNEFQNTALYTLGQQQENPYAIIPELYNEYAKGMYALSNNGGLSGGQRALARLTAMNNFMNQTAKLQQAAQSSNIAHKQTWANALLNAGAQNATNRSAAKRYDLDYYSKAHAAKLAGEQEARKGAYAQLMAGIKGIVDSNRYDEAMDLYRQKSKAETDYYAALTRNLMGNKVTAKNSKDWSWLPKVYGPLNKGVSIQAKPVNSGIYYNPMSFYGAGALSPMIYKYNGPTLTKPIVKLY